MKILSKIAALFTTALTPVEKVAHALVPLIEADLVAFSATLPDAFTSLETMAEKAQQLLLDLKGIKISKSVAIAIAQKVFTQNKASILAEAKALLKLLGIA